MDQPDDPSVENRGLTNDLWSLLDECWEYTPQLRPSMSDFVSAIQDKDSLRERAKMAAHAYRAVSHVQDDLKRVLDTLQRLDLTGRLLRHKRRTEGDLAHIYIGSFHEESASDEVSATKLAIKKYKQSGSSAELINLLVSVMINSVTNVM